MANIHDYLQWRGDLTLAERPFNDVDNVILSVLSYIDFTDIVPSEDDGGSVELSHACRKLIELCGGHVRSRVRSLFDVDTRFLELLAASRRFGSATLGAYADVVDESRSLQFSALQVGLPTGETYVAFRGTDSTLVGWREDFMLSFEVTEAQRMALQYLERVIERAGEQGQGIRVGGHSKGGNLAEYAAVCCREDLRDRIVMVYSNDGPGMAPEVMQTSARLVLGSRMRRIVPSYSVIGMLFARAEDARIIAASSGTGLIGQHDPTSWQVIRSGMDEVLDLLPDCKVLDEAVAAWTETVPLDERERVTNEVFDALGAGGATRLDEIAATTEGLQRVLRALSNTDERTRELATRLMESTVNSSVTAVRKATQATMEAWRKSMQEAAEGAARSVQEAAEDAARSVQEAAEDAARKLFGAGGEG